MIKYVIYWLICEYKDNSWRIKDRKKESSIYGDVWGFLSNGRNVKKSFQRKLRQHGVYYGHDVELELVRPITSHQAHICAHQGDCDDDESWNQVNIQY